MRVRLSLRVQGREGKSEDENVMGVTPYFDGVILGTSIWLLGGTGIHTALRKQAHWA